MPSYLDTLAPSDLNGKLRVALGYPNAGWVLMALLANPYNQSVVVHCSTVFEPFTGLLRWLDRVADEDLPAELTIDEEMRRKHLLALPTDATGVIEFRVADGEGQTLMRCYLARGTLLREFLQCLREWLAEGYDPQEFRTGADLCRLNIDMIAAKMSPSPL